MSDGDVQALVVDNGSGMCKVRQRTADSSSRADRRPLALCPVSQSHSDSLDSTPFERQSPFECPGCHLAVHCDATPACCPAPLRCDTIPPLPAAPPPFGLLANPAHSPRHPFVCILFPLNCVHLLFLFLFSFTRPVSLEMMLPAPCSRRLSAARATKSAPTRAHRREARAGRANTASRSHRRIVLMFVPCVCFSLSFSFCVRLGSDGRHGPEGRLRR